MRAAPEVINSLTVSNCLTAAQKQSGLLRFFKGSKLNSHLSLKEPYPGRNPQGSLKQRHPAAVLEFGTE